jgi:cell division septum initiation protein DivIVA
MSGSAVDGSGDESLLGLGFEIVRRGYDPERVRAFVAETDAELRRLAGLNRDLVGRIGQLESELGVASRALDEARRAAMATSVAVASTPLAQPSTGAAPTHGEWNAAAADMVRGARAEAETILAAARSQAMVTLERADAEAQVVRARAADDARALRSGVEDQVVHERLAEVQRQRDAIAASLMSLQAALASAVSSMQPSVMPPPTRTLRA